MSKIYIAKKLKECREKQGITINDVATHFKKSIKTIYSWESGQGQPDADSLIELCIMYGITNFDILSEELSHQSDIDIVKSQINENYKNLNTDGRKKLAEYSEDLVASSKYKKSNSDNSSEIA